MTVKAPMMSSLIHKLQQAVLFSLTSQSSIKKKKKTNKPSGVQAVCCGRPYWKISLSVCKLGSWRSEMVPLIGR